MDLSIVSQDADIAQLNTGLDYKGLKLRAPTDICIGASVDLGKGIEADRPEARTLAEAPRRAR